MPEAFWERHFFALLTELLKAALSSAPLDEGRRRPAAPGVAEGYRVPTRGSRPEDEASALEGRIDGREETASSVTLPEVCPRAGLRLTGLSQPPLLFPAICDSIHPNCQRLQPGPSDLHDVCVTPPASRWRTAHL